MTAPAKVLELLDVVRIRAASLAETKQRYAAFLRRQELSQCANTSRP